MTFTHRSTNRFYCIQLIMFYCWCHFILILYVLYFFSSSVFQYIYIVAHIKSVALCYGKLNVYKPSHNQVIIHVSWFFLKNYMLWVYTTCIVLVYIALLKGHVMICWPDLIHFLFYSTCIYEQVSLEQSNSKVWANYYVAVLILYVKVHFKSVRRLQRGKFVFYSR